MFWKYDRKNDGEEIVILCDIDFKLQGRAHIGSVSLNDFSHNLMPQHLNALKHACPDN